LVWDSTQLSRLRRWGVRVEPVKSRVVRVFRGPPRGAVLRGLKPLCSLRSFAAEMVPVVPAPSRGFSAERGTPCEGTRPTKKRLKAEG